MKGLNINIPSCTSDNSIAIISSNMESPSSSSSSPSSSSSTFTSGGRAIDRHNPIITDEKRSGFSNSCTTTPIRTPLTNNVLQKKPTTPTPLTFSPKPLQSPPKKKGNMLPTFTRKSIKRNNVAAAKKPPVYSSKNIIEGDKDDHNKSGRRSFSKPSDLIMKAAAAACTNARPGVDYISPPESSRYLLDDTSFLEVLSDFDPVLKLVPHQLNTPSPTTNTQLLKPESSKFSVKSSSSGPSDQVVVLRVSLHCRGCERKMKKHLSRMAGVRSFNIDFAAKKVTVVGDVTPLEVLASISKVKTAQLWTPVMQSSPQLNDVRNMQLKTNQL